METVSCRYENGDVNSAFDCQCTDCKNMIAEYENYLNEQAKEEEYNSVVESAGVCNE